MCARPWTRRCTSSALCVALSVMRSGARWLTLLSLGWVLAQGLCLFCLNFVCFLNASQTVASGLVAVVFSSSALWNALLARLVRQAGQVVTHRQLLADVWGAEHTDQTHYLRLYMGQLRGKLEADTSDPQHLLTEPGVGYRAAEPDANDAGSSDKLMQS